MRFTGDVDVPIRIVYANETIERLSGYSRAELLEPSNPFLQVQPQNRALYEAHFVNIRAGQPVRSMFHRKKKTICDSDAVCASATASRRRRRLRSV